MSLFVEIRKRLGDFTLDARFETDDPVTGLLGASGCGKSTIAGLICGKNREYKGSVRIGGIDVPDIREEDLMRKVVLVRHNSYLFKGTVEDNLKMAKAI